MQKIDFQDGHHGGHLDIRKTAPPPPPHTHENCPPPPPPPPPTNKGFTVHILFSCICTFLMYLNNVDNNNNKTAPRKSTFLGRPTWRNSRRAPQFSISLWNVYNRVEDGLPRTNNTDKGWHRSFQSNVGAHHPTIRRFLDVLKREQSLNEVNITQIVAGYAPNPQQKQYLDSAARISVVVRDLPNRHILTYLHRIANNLQF